MTPSFSTYLNLIRFIAAIAVVFDHISTTPFTDNVIWWRLGMFGPIAVTIFFLLSGYVIAYVTTTRERDAMTYCASRIGRLYSVVLIALPLTLIFDTAGMHLNPHFYADKIVLEKPESLAGYLSSLFFVNEYQFFQFKGVAPGSNGPFWSLSFEVTYYLLAGLALFTPRLIWIPISLLVLGLAGKTIATLLPIWLMGYLLFRFRNRWTMARGTSIAVFSSSAVLLLCAPRIAQMLPYDNFGLFLPWGRTPSNRNLIQDYLAAFAFAGHLISARSLLSEAVVVHKRIRNAIAWLGSLTFPLYCLHFPAICLFSAISPWSASSKLNLVFVGAATMVLTLVVTPVCDAFKVMIRDHVLSALHSLKSQLRVTRQ